MNIKPIVYTCICLPIMFFLLTALYIVPTVSYAQAPDTLWTKTYGGAADDIGFSIKQTSDGGYIIAGYTESFGAGQMDVWLLKTDANGDTIWTKTYGGSLNDWARDIQLTADGGYIIVANTTSFDLTGAIWLIKTNSLGDTMWTKIHSSQFNDICYAVQQTSDSGYIMAGYFVISALLWRPLLLKTDVNGDTVWVKYSFGIWSVGWLYSVQETYDGSYIVAGGLGDIFFHDCYLCKVDSLGNDLWGTGDWDGNGTFLSVLQVPDSGYTACGWNDYNGQRVIIAKINSQGDTLWTREYGDLQTGYEWSGQSVQLTNDNGYIVAGHRYDFPIGDLVLLRLNRSGDSLWCTLYGGAGNDKGYEVLQTNDGGYIVVGSTESYGAGGSDVWLIKTEPNVGIEENERSIVTNTEITTTIFCGPLQLPEGRTCKVFDITGRVIMPETMKPGVYFLEIDGVVTQKVVKIR